MNGAASMSAPVSQQQASIPQTPSGTAFVALSGELSIYKAADVKYMLQQELQQCAVLEVDLGGVTEIDSAGIQVLILAKLTARDEGRELRLVHHSQAVLEVFERLALDRWFGDALPDTQQAAA